MEVLVSLFYIFLQNFILFCLFVLADSENKIYLSEALEKLGVNSTSRDKDEFIGPAFVKFSFIIKELSQLEKNLVCFNFFIAVTSIFNLFFADAKYSQYHHVST